MASAILAVLSSMLTKVSAFVLTKVSAFKEGEESVVFSHSSRIQGVVVEGQLFPVGWGLVKMVYSCVPPIGVFCWFLASCDCILCNML